jgi:hypothetical protein
MSVGSTLSCIHLPDQSLSACTITVDDHTALSHQPRIAKLSTSSSKPTSTSTPSRILGALSNLLPHRSPGKQQKEGEKTAEPEDASGDMARASKSKSKSKSVEAMEVDHEEVEIVENQGAESANEAEGEDEKDDAPVAEGEIEDEEQDEEGEYEVESIVGHKQSGVSCPGISVETSAYLASCCCTIYS